ncbi:MULTISPECIES: DUF3140 domain-containing protein [unclassified Luteibacter]|uniref:DUF3140 domain-containing protein n=1 Tax=unclassified Luteibacter TaxID=2620188 RepID=UPI0008B1BC90|nr:MULTISPECIES: DUF3140 domain-containing protein [unclassified Luteibacter]MDR6935920.1 hypothetical protein [Luteibacter sp. 3190]SEV90520.1 Protein of unknown function [Luteibacter sp. 329MFSha]
MSIDDERASIIKDFHAAVNMTAKRLETWLATDESKAVGAKEGGRESVGHASGRRIVRLLGKAQRDLTEGDLRHMRKVNGYVARHLAQRPAGNVKDTPWRYSLMNWGHDPLRR